MPNAYSELANHDMTFTANVGGTAYPWYVPNAGGCTECGPPQGGGAGE